MKRNLAIASVVAIIIGLVAINLAMRTDPEPEFEPMNDALPARPYSPTLIRDAGNVEAEAEAQDPGLDTEGETGAEVDGCDHPLVAARAGQWRTYDLTQTGLEQGARMVVRAMSTRELESGEREVSWYVRAMDAENDEGLEHLALRTRCRPGEDAEEPWFGILLRSLGHVITRRTPRWRWPAELAPGISFRGTATLDPSAADVRLPDGVEEGTMLTVTRNHVVAERETIEVEAGRFDAWRVAYEEQHIVGSLTGETATGTLWVAEDIGLVKSHVENSHGVTQTIELVRFGDE